jgi:hypothetical protein
MENHTTMKKLKKFGYPAIFLLLTSLSITSCSDTWDAHYGLENTGKIDSNLFDYIKSRNDLSIFQDLIQKTGYDSILNQSKAYTVWAPTNTALEGNPILLDTANWKNLVGNHIASYTHPVSQADSMTITMQNGKRLLYNYETATATMDGYTLIEKDKATNNGLVQVMNDVLPYRYNQWENILTISDLDSLRAYVLSMNKKTLDRNRSFDNGVFIDSFFITTNQILSYLGDFNLEDSIYTSILPNNAAWIDAYNRISPYFKTKPTDGGAVTQRANTQWNLVHDLFFWGRINAPTGDSVLVSTNWNKLINPDSLFMNSEKMILSNGYGYKTSKLYHKPKDSWCKEIRVEAENSTGGRTSTNFDITSLSSLGTKFSASRNNYIYCKPTSTSALSPLTVTFPIPNTLSTKYNIYAVFIPTVITDTTDKRPYKLEFSISLNANTAAPLYTKLNVPKNVTDSISITKLLLAKNYEFLTTNLISSGGGIAATKTPKEATTPITIGLKIKNIAGTTPAEIKNFNRGMRIDCLILEPVQ